MNKKRILVAYATKSGTTVEVALAIGQALDDQKAFIDVRSVQSVNDLSRYDAAVVGSGVRTGKWLPPAVHFVEEQQEALQKMPVAFYTVCMTMVDDTPENRQIVEAYMRPVRTLVEPVSMGLFAGRIDPDRLSLWERLVVRVVGRPEGDFRDWTSIHDWARSLRPLLLNPSSQAAT